MAGPQSSLVSIHSRTSPRALPAAMRRITNVFARPLRRQRGATVTRMTSAPAPSSKTTRGRPNQAQRILGNQEEMSTADVIGRDIVDIGVARFIHCAEMLAQTLQDQAPGGSLVGWGEGTDGQPAGSRIMSRPFADIRHIGLAVAQLLEQQQRGLIVPLDQRGPDLQPDILREPTLGFGHQPARANPDAGMLDRPPGG